MNVRVLINMAWGDFTIALGKTFDAINALSWPLVALILAIIFRKVVADLVTALKNMSLRVTKVAGILELEDQTEVVLPQGPPEVPLANVVGDDPDLQGWAAQAEQTLQRSNVPQGEVRARLIRAWAHANRARLFDRLGRLMFKTQLDALRKIETGPVDGRSLRPFYRDHIARARASGAAEDRLMDFAKWLEFLLANELVTRPGQGPYTITDKGKAFLVNANETGLPDIAQL